jgi:hypothetical protein
MKEGWLKQGWLVFTAFVLALAQLRLLQMLPDLGTSLPYAMHAVLDQNDWPGYRSRLLAPYLIHFLGGDMGAFLGVTFVALVIGGLLSWRLAGFGGMGTYHALCMLDVIRRIDISVSVDERKGLADVRIEGATVRTRGYRIEREETDEDGDLRERLVALCGQLVAHPPRFFQPH